MPPADPGPEPRRPFPESLCHACAAPPRYVTSDRGSVFIFCPLYRKYPPQPVLACAGFVPAPPRPGR
ncbi:MAG TPA: hypothetical protein VLI67_01085 [Vicinamibacteria bacterium]|nr:hypothetical protein [Vicinamibacteria bacterium]